MTTEASVKAFLLDPDRRTMLTVKGIETKCEIPEGNLSKFLAGKRGLPAVQIETLVGHLKKIGFGLVDVTAPAADSSPAWGNTLPLFSEPEPPAADEMPKDSGNEPELVSSLVEAEERFNELKETAKGDFSSSIEREEILAAMSPWERAKELETLREIQERDDLWEWINMPAERTQRQLDEWQKTFSKRRMLTGLVLQVRVIIGQYDVPASWRCYVELTEANGKMYRDRHRKDFVYHKQASQKFCEAIYEDKSWTYTQQGNVHFYTKPVGNPVIEPKPKPEKVKKVKPVVAAPAEESKSVYLLDLIGNDGALNSIVTL